MIEIIYQYADLKTQMTTAICTYKGKFQCYLFFPSDKMLQPGLYKMSGYKSPKHGCIVPHFDGFVPENGKQYCYDISSHHYELHWGNFRKDTDGCGLFGVPTFEHGNMCCAYSKDAFKKFMSEVDFIKDKHYCRISCAKYYKSSYLCRWIDLTKQNPITNVEKI